MVRRVQGYPTVKGFVNGKPAGDHNGERTAGAVKDWALNLVPNHITTLNRQPQVRILRSPHDFSGIPRCRCFTLEGAAHEASIVLKPEHADTSCGHAICRPHCSSC